MTTAEEWGEKCTILTEFNPRDAKSFNPDYFAGQKTREDRDPDEGVFKEVTRKR